MKKIIILGLVLLMVIVFATSVSVMAKEGKGAVKVDLTERTGGEANYWASGLGDPAGWAIINTTASGKIQIQIHMYSAIEGTYLVYARFEGVLAPYLTELTVNKNGKGNAHVEIDIPVDAEVSLKVQVLVKEKVSGTPGYSGLTEVPLKK